MSLNQTLSPTVTELLTEAEEVMSPNRSSSPETVVMQSPVLRVDTSDSPKGAPPTPPPGIGPFRKPEMSTGEPLAIAIVSSQNHHEKIATTFPGQVVKAYATMHMLSIMTPPLSELARADLVVVEIPMHEFTQKRYCHALKMLCLRLLGSAHQVSVIVTAPLRSKVRSQTKYVSKFVGQLKK